MYLNGRGADAYQIRCRREHHCRGYLACPAGQSPDGAILAAAPIITTLAFLFTYNEAGVATTQQLVIGAFYFAIPTLAFLLTLYFLMGRFAFFQALAGRTGSGSCA